MDVASAPATAPVFGGRISRAKAARNGAGDTTAAERRRAAEASKRLRPGCTAKSGGRSPAARSRGDIGAREAIGRGADGTRDCPTAITASCGTPPGCRGSEPALGRRPKEVSQAGATGRRLRGAIAGTAARGARAAGIRLGRSAGLLRHGPRAQGRAQAHRLHRRPREQARARACAGDGAEVTPGAQHRAPVRNPCALHQRHHLRAGRGSQAALHDPGAEGAHSRRVHRAGTQAHRRQHLLQGPGGGVRARLQHHVRLRALPVRADGLRPQVRRRDVPLQLALGRRFHQLRLRPGELRAGGSPTCASTSSWSSRTRAPRASA